MPHYLNPDFQSFFAALGLNTTGDTAGSRAAARTLVRITGLVGRDDDDGGAERCGDSGVLPPTEEARETSWRSTSRDAEESLKARRWSNAGSTSYDVEPALDQRLVCAVVINPRRCVGFPMWGFVKLLSFSCSCSQEDNFPHVNHSWRYGFVLSV